jgi:hypothetical protein
VYLRSGYMGGCLWGEVVDYTCKNVNDEEFGEVEWGSITLKAQVVECPVVSGHKPTLGFHRAQRTRESMISLYWDCHDDDFGGEDPLRIGATVYVLRAYQTDYNDYHLILRKSSSRDVFHRIGMLKLSSSNSEIGAEGFKDIEYSTVTIE